MNDTNQLQKEAERTRERLLRLRDESKVRAKLAQMDAEDTWDRLRGQIDTSLAGLDRAQDAWSAKTDEAKIQGQLALLDARERAEHLEERIGDIWDEIGSQAESTGEKVRGQIDLAGLRAHLAKMEAQDFLQAKRDALEATARESTDKARDQLVSGLEKLNAKLEGLVNRIR